MLGFRFTPRIRDLNERRLYGLVDLAPYPTLKPLVAGPVNIRSVEEHWDEMLRPAASIRAGTVSASVMLKAVRALPWLPRWGLARRGSLAGTVGWLGFRR